MSKNVLLSTILIISFNWINENIVKTGATTPPDTIKQPSSDLKPTLVQPEPSNIRLEPSKLAEPPVSGVEKSKVEPKPVDPTVIVPVVAAIIIICCGFLSVVIMYCFKIYSVKKSIDGDKPQEVYEVWLFIDFI